ASHKPATTASTATSPRTERFREVMRTSTRVSRGAAGLQPATTDEPKREGSDREQRRHRQDVDDREELTEALDIGVEAPLSFTQLLANAHALLREAFDLGLLLGRQRHRMLLATRAFQAR